MRVNPVHYRRAAAPDAAALAAFGAQSFVDAYAGSNAPEDVARHLARTYSAELQLAELEDSGSWTVLADRGGEIVGAALIRWQAPPPPVASEGRWAEIKRFYVGRPCWRTGVSGQLMVEALASIRDAGGSAVWLQVWEHAAQAIGFYRKWGFRESGRTTFQVGGDRQSDLVMIRSLTSA